MPVLNRNIVLVWQREHHYLDKEPTMKKPINIALLFLITLVMSCTHGKDQLNGAWSRGQKNSIAEAIERVINNTDPNVNIGVKISSLNNHETIFEKNAQRLFMPASTIKLVTLASALHYLGPSFRFETKVFTDAFDAEKKSVQNLYLKGSGDPSLMDYDLANLALELKQMGIKKINGQVFIDDQIFDDVLWGRGIMWDDRNAGYSAPVSGLNMNHNRLQIKTVPAHKSSLRAHAIVTPALSMFQVKSEALTKANNAGRLLSLTIEHADHRKEEWPSETKDGLKAGDKITINGQTPLNADPHYSLLAVNDPSMMTGTYFKEQLEHLGIEVSGKVTRAATPAVALLLTTFQSRSLSEALIDFTKISNNVANDSLIKAMAAVSGIKPASASAGLKLVNDFLAKEVGIPSGTLVAADGAGVSRYSLMSPDHMVRLLSYASDRFNLSPEFMAALPIGGMDGSLGRRMQNEYQKGNVRAKTGTMTGISCISGYFSNELGQRFAFAIMINGFVGSSQKYNKMQDDILATFVSPSEAQVTGAR